MIRVLRVIEYIYDDHEVMIRDMGRWNLGANASKKTPTSEIRSAVLLPTLEVADWGEIEHLQLRREIENHPRDVDEIVGTVSVRADGSLHYDIPGHLPPGTYRLRVSGDPNA